MHPHYFLCFLCLIYFGWHQVFWYKNKSFVHFCNFLTRTVLLLKSVDYGRMAEILVQRAASLDEFTRLTAITWVSRFTFWIYMCVCVNLYFYSVPCNLSPFTISSLVYLLWCVHLSMSQVCVNLFFYSVPCNLSPFTISSMVYRLWCMCLSMLQVVLSFWQVIASLELYNLFITLTVQINEFVKLGGEQLVPYYADILGAILPCISDKEEKIRVVSWFKLSERWKICDYLIILRPIFWFQGCSWNQWRAPCNQGWSCRWIWCCSNSLHCKEV